MSATPILMFNGTYQIVGASTSDEDGARYMNIIEGRSLDACPIRIETDFVAGTGAASATVTMYSQTETVDGTFYFILIEDDLSASRYGYDTEVTRALYSEAISLSGEGSTALFDHTFTLDASWDTANLRVIAFVQKASKEVVQAASNDVQPTNKVRAMVPFSRNIIGASSGTYTTGDFAVLNIGAADTFYVDLYVDLAPAGWTVEYCDALDVCQSTQTTVSLGAGESADYYLKVTPTSPGYMRFHLEFSSPLVRTISAPFAYFTNDIDILVVDGDAGEAYEGYFTTALDAAGLSYGVWDLTGGNLTQEAADTYPILVWSTGLGYPSPPDLSFLRGYLDAGKGLFITGQDIGWGLARPGSGADPAFVHDYLHAGYLADDSGSFDLVGVPNDPVSGGIDLHIQGGDGANNQDWKDVINAYDGDAVEIFNYATGTVGAVRSLDSTTNARVIYLGFGFEAIDNPTDRADLMAAAVAWLRGTIFLDDFESGDIGAWSGGAY